MAREPVGISDARLFLWQFTQPHREGKPDHRGCVTTCRAKAAVLVNSAAMDDVTSLIEGLNPAQRDAVTAEDRHLLVLGRSLPLVPPYLQWWRNQYCLPTCWRVGAIAATPQGPQAE